MIKSEPKEHKRGGNYKKERPLEYVYMIRLDFVESNQNPEDLNLTYATLKKGLGRIDGRIGGEIRVFVSLSSKHLLLPSEVLINQLALSLSLSL